MKQIIVDTNGFLRFLLNDIPAQKKVLETLLFQAKGTKIVILVPEIVIFELCFILDQYYHFKKDQVIDRLQSLVSMDYLEINSRQVFMTAFQIYGNESISLVDAFLLALSEIRQAELFTFDNKLKNLLKPTLIQK